MNQTALSKLKDTLQLASEFVKDENSYCEPQYATGGVYVNASISFGGVIQNTKKKSHDIRTKAELEASKLERQERAAKQIKECLEYLNTVTEFEGEKTVGIGTN